MLECLAMVAPYLTSIYATIDGLFQARVDDELSYMVSVIHSFRSATKISSSAFPRLSSGMSLRRLVECFAFRLLNTTKI